MQNERYPRSDRNNKPSKRYKIDYNRAITAAMILVIIVLGIIIWVDASKEPRQPAVNQLTLPQPTDAVPAGTNDDIQLSPDELRPLPEQEGYLPIFLYANTNEKVVAITVEDFESAEDIETLAAYCSTYGAKITFIPTGEELAKFSSSWLHVIFSGHEIENHTYSGQRLQQLKDEDKVPEITRQTELLRSIIGQGYEPHFLRTDYLEDEEDAFLHSWLNGSGYMGIVRWDVNDPASINDVRPGAILNFSVSGSGLDAIKQAVAVLSENGYRMVTLNELFEYPDNLPVDASTAG